jgi:hypothetical protein
MRVRDPGPDAVPERRGAGGTTRGAEGTWLQTRGGLIPRADSREVTRQRHTPGGTQTCPFEPRVWAPARPRGGRRTGGVASDPAHDRTRQSS